MPKNKKESIHAGAIHEASHAIAAYATGGRMQKRGIVLDGPLKGKTYIGYTVIGHRNHAGRWKYHPEILRLAHWGNILNAFAGPIAESKVTHDFAHAYGDARDIAFHLRELLRGNGALAKICDQKKYGPHFRAVTWVLAIQPHPEKALAAWDAMGGTVTIDISVARMLARFAKLAHTITRRNWTAVEDLATELVKKRKMTGKEVEEVISRHRIVGPSYPPRLKYGRTADYSHFFYSQRIVFGNVNEPSGTRTRRRRATGKLQRENR